MGRRKGSIDPEKERLWRGVMKRFQKTGLPFRKFCTNENISPNTFQFWRRELRERDEKRGKVSEISKGENKPSQLLEKIKYWRQVIKDLDAYQGSGRSFLRKRGISSGNLHYWRTRLQEMDSNGSIDSESTADDFVAVKILDKEKLEQAERIQRPPKESEAHRIDIRLNDGTTIAASNAIPIEVLLKLVNGLRGGCTK
jgi:transposase-like protein